VPSGAEGAGGTEAAKDALPRDFTEVLPSREAREGEVLCAAIQFASELGRVECNRTGLLRMARRAAGRGAKLIVMPETAVQGYASQNHRTVWARPDFPNITTEKSLAGFAETVPGDSTRAFGAVSKEFGCHIAVALAEHEPASGRYFNSLVVTGPDGAVACHYRKLHPWTVMEYAWSSEGDRGRGVFDTPWGRIGVMICYDIHNELGPLADCDLAAILYSVAWVDEHPATWFDERLPALCRERRAALVLANWSSSRELERNPGFGFSRIISAEGEVIARAVSDHANEVVYGFLPSRRR
jgi:predicted amidohydrolase